MSPPKAREQSTGLAVLSQKVETLDGRVTDLEEENEARRNSNEGFRKELSEHLIADAKFQARLETSIGAADFKLKIVLWAIGVLLLVSGGVGAYLAGQISDLTKAAHTAPQRP
jgi:hypothetical protein